MEEKHKGQTTYIVNSTIELLFRNIGEIVLKDHPIKENHLERLDEYKQNNERLLKLVENRLGSEHERELIVRREGDDIIIKLKPQENNG